MKIKLNQRYVDHEEIMKRLAVECPELEVKSKERKWGLKNPSFKYKKNLYEFDHVDELMDQVRKIIRLKKGDYNKKLKNHVKDIDPLEEGFGENRSSKKDQV